MTPPETIPLPQNGAKVHAAQVRVAIGAIPNPFDPAQNPNYGPIPKFENAPSQRSDLRAFSVTELLKMDVKPREMLLHPFLPTQGLAMLYSRRGVGKTFLSLGIAVAVASGGKFLNWNAPTRRNVLYVDGEMPFSALHQPGHYRRQ